MNFLNKLERKMGKFAIPNLTLYLIICYVFGYIIRLVNPGFMSYLTLNMYEIFHGQVWRLITWVIIPPSDLNIFTIIMLFFYYSIGSTLERTWGTFRYNVYLFSGMLFTVIGALLLHLYLILSGGAGTMFGGVVTQISVAGLYSVIAGFFSTYYVCMSITLAFAATFPNTTILLMMVIPIKIKILGIIYGAVLAFEFVQAGMQGLIPQQVSILFSLLNFLIFFLTSRRWFRSPKQVKRQQQFKKQTVRMQKISKHKCAICGRTEEDGDGLEFRFCSKCDGNYEYCSDHLFSHTHIVRH